VNFCSKTIRVVFGSIFILLARIRRFGGCGVCLQTCGNSFPDIPGVPTGIICNLQDQDVPNVTGCAHVEHLIPPAKRGGRRRKVDERAVMNGLLYILSTGCQWRHIPRD
jgi:Putative transposase of IS4/5 family (DUF4096)